MSKFLQFIPELYRLKLSVWLVNFGLDSDATRLSKSGHESKTSTRGCRKNFVFFLNFLAENNSRRMNNCFTPLVRERVSCDATPSSVNVNLNRIKLVSLRNQKLIVS